MIYKFKGKLLKLVTKKIRLPNGYRLSLELIEHPGAALIVPFLNSNTLIFIKQYRPAVGGYLYELPAGTLDPKETPLACARREIIEETGYAAGTMTPLAKIYPVPGYSTEIIYIFKAQNLKIKTRHHEPDEVISLCPLTKSQVKKLFQNKKIRDAKTICALAFCGWV